MLQYFTLNKRVSMRLFVAFLISTAISNCASTAGSLMKKESISESNPAGEDQSRHDPVATDSAEPLTNSSKKTPLAEPIKSNKIQK
jgi:hypothetical protein